MPANVRASGWKRTYGDATGIQLAALVPDAYPLIHIAAASDADTDWNVASPSHPTLYVHSNTTPATDYLSIAHDATNATINVASGSLILAIDGTTELTLSSTAMTLASTAVTLTSTSTLVIGTSGTPLANTAGTPTASIYTTSSSTSGSTSVQPFIVDTVLTAAGSVGGRALFHLTINAGSAGWTNAIKGLVDYGASGSTSGMGSSVLAEMALSAGTTAGTYAPFEAEITIASGASTGTATSFLYGNITGTGAATANANGYLFELGTGITTGSGTGLFATTSAAAVDPTHSLKCRIAGTTYYIPLSTSQTF